MHTRVLLFCGCALLAAVPARAQSPTGASVVLPAITVTGARDLEAEPPDRRRMDQPLPAGTWAMLDLDLAYTRARYDIVGDQIPGAPQVVAAAGITLGDATGWCGGLRWRYFGPRPLVEDGSVWSAATSLFNARAGYVFENGLKLQLDGFNIFNTQASQIDYYYQSKLRNESAPVSDIHFHPVEPMAFRLTVAKAF